MAYLQLVELSHDVKWWFILLFVGKLWSVKNSWHYLINRFPN